MSLKNTIQINYIWRICEDGILLSQSGQGKRVLVQTWMNLSWPFYDGKQVTSSVTGNVTRCH